MNPPGVLVAVANGLDQSLSPETPVHY